MKSSSAVKTLRFIPFRNRDILQMCLQDGRLQGVEEKFRLLHRMLGSIYHFEFHQQIEALKDTYASLDPDADTRCLDTLVPPGKDDFSQQLQHLLNQANYEPISQQDLDQALEESSLIKVRLQVDFSDYAEVLLFCRGESSTKASVSKWFGLRKKEIAFLSYERVVVYLRFKEEGVDTHLDESPFRGGSILLKLFRNVPKADLEILFPNPQVRMRLVDKLMIGIPAMVSGGVVISTKLGASLILLGSLFGFWLGMHSQPVVLDKTALMALLAGLGALGGYLWKQFNNFKNRKLRYMQELTKSLYFKNLDNGAGVFYRLANDAEEEESKEAILAYFILLVTAKPMGREELDREIESWLSEKWQCEIDFEIDDALDKLLSMGLAQSVDGYFNAIPVDEALYRLDRQWDDYFISVNPASMPE